MRDLLIPIILTIIGLGFSYSGFKIAILKRFETMIGYYSNKRRYVNHTAFAMRNGIIELAGGIALLIAGFLAAYFRLTREAFLISYLGTIVIVILLKLNKIFSKKKF